MFPYLVAILAASFSALCAFLLITSVNLLDPTDTHRH